MSKIVYIKWRQGRRLALLSYCIQQKCETFIFKLIFLTKCCIPLPKMCPPYTVYANKIWPSYKTLTSENIFIIINIIYIWILRFMCRWDSPPAVGQGWACVVARPPGPGGGPAAPASALASYRGSSERLASADRGGEHRPQGRTGGQMEPQKSLAEQLMLT